MRPLNVYRISRPALGGALDVVTTIVAASLAEAAEAAGTDAYAVELIGPATGGQRRGAIVIDLTEGAPA